MALSRLCRALFLLPPSTLIVLAGMVFPFNVLMAPCSNSLENRTHSFSVSGDAVLHSGRDFRLNGAANQSLLLQSAKRRGKDLV
jgi:hypothetical protein